MYFEDAAFMLKTILHKLPLSPKPGARKMEYKGNSWHETCFLCHRCQQPIGTKSFIPKDSGYFCVPCFEKQYAYQCCACKKVGCDVLQCRLSPHVTDKRKKRKKRKTRLVHSCLFVISRPSQQEGWPIRRNPGIASVSCASAVGSNCQGSVSQPGKITPIALNASATSMPRNASAVPSQSPVSRHVFFFVFFYLLWHHCHSWAVTETTWALSISDVCRSCRGQVHLLWGASVAQRVFHLHAVLHFPGGTRLPHSAWQHLVHRLWQGKVKIPPAQFIINLVQLCGCSIFLFFFQHAIRNLLISDAFHSDYSLLSQSVHT